MQYAIQLVEITKRYPGVVANNRATLRVPQNSILALVGENGAGKSTLMKIAYGLEKPDSGEIYLGKEKLQLRNAADAIQKGIGMVHQHFMLVSELTVLENIILGNECRRGLVIDWESSKQKVKNLMSEYNFNFDLNEKISDLSIAVQQKVEILKLLYRGADILIFDEPTAVLTPQEIVEFFQQLKQLTASGKTIIFITHKLKEVMDISQFVVVMRKGKIVGRKRTKDTNPKEIAYLMVGEKLAPVINTNRQYGNERLKIEKLTVLDNRKRAVIRDLSLGIRSGQIVGLAGVAGNGQTELASALTGLLTPSKGKIYLDNEDITYDNNFQKRQKGLGFIPEDRTRVGLCLPWSVGANLVAGFHRDKKYKTNGFLSWPEIFAHSKELINQFGIKTPEVNSLISTLSGGNQQKVVVAREISRNPKFLLAAEPTRGVDIGAKRFIHEQILELKNKNAAILLISSDLDEILALSDKIAVIFKGQIIDVVNPSETTPEEIGLLMAGLKGSEDGA